MQFHATLNPYFELSKYKINSQLLENQLYS